MGGRGGPGRTCAPRACVVVHTSVEVLFGLDGPGELANGVSISPDTVRRLSWDGRLEVVTENAEWHTHRDRPGLPSGSGLLARQVRRRDQGCRFPECPRTQIQIHHLDWWVRDRGRTDLDGLLGACRKQHRLLHEGKWIVERHADGSVSWISPSGARCTSALPGPRPEVVERIVALLPFRCPSRRIPTRVVPPGPQRSRRRAARPPRRRPSVAAGEGVSRRWKPSAPRRPRSAWPASP